MVRGGGAMFILEEKGAAGIAIVYREKGGPQKSTINEGGADVNSGVGRASRLSLYKQIGRERISQENGSLRG